MKADEPTKNPSQPLIDADNDRRRIIAELSNPNLADEDRSQLHHDLAEAEDGYHAAVTRLKPSKIPGTKSSS